jgi:hypothetical protein
VGERPSWPAAQALATEQGRLEGCGRVRSYLRDPNDHGLVALDPHEGPNALPWSTGPPLPPAENARGDCAVVGGPAGDTLSARAGLGDFVALVLILGAEVGYRICFAVHQRAALVGWDVSLFQVRLVTHQVRPSFRS